MVAELLYSRSDLLNAYHDQEMMYAEISIVNCKLCERPLRPWRFLEDFDITYCPKCDGCWCDVCEGERKLGYTYRGKDRVYSFFFFLFSLRELGAGV